jgi:hypothetical protein
LRIKEVSHHVQYPSYDNVLLTNFIVVRDLIIISR